MASTEIQLLKFIWKNKGKASLLEIAKELKMSIDYSRLICKDLLKNKFVEFFQGQYKITDLGKNKLETLGMIEKAGEVTKPKKPKKPTGAKKEETVAKREVKRITITELSGLTPKLIEELKHKGFRTLEDIAATSISRLLEAIGGLELKQAADMINEARNKLRKEGKEYLWEG